MLCFALNDDSSPVLAYFVALFEYDDDDWSRRGL